MTAKVFLEQFMPYHDRIYRLSLRLLGNQTDAADLVQDVYVKLWNMRHQMMHYNNTEAFAMTMTKNLCYDRLMSSERRTISLNPQQVIVENISPDKILEYSETHQSIEEFISRLPEVQQLVMHLRDIENYEFEHIAEVTGLNLNHIRVSLSRARKSVREQLVYKSNYGNTKN